MCIAEKHRPIVPSQRQPHLDVLICLEKGEKPHPPSPRHPREDDTITLFSSSFATRSRTGAVAAALADYPLPVEDVGVCTPHEEEVD